MFGKGFFFIAACMALIAASVGAILHYAAGITAVEAAFAALALLFGLMTVESVSARSRDRMEMNERIEGLARASADIAREVGELSHRLQKIEAAPAQDMKTYTEPLAKEIGDLAELIEDLAKSVAEHDSQLSQGAMFGSASGEEFSGSAQKKTEATAATPVAGAPRKAANNPLAQLQPADIAALIRDALENKRIDIHLQPIVTLPQRKVRFYEAVSRLRLPEGSLIEAQHFIDAARATGVVTKLDEHLVQSSVQVVRRLAAKSREVGVFFNLAPETLCDRNAMAAIMGQLEANRAIAPSLIIELAQGDFRSPNAAYRESLLQLHERGYRFAIDHVADLHIDPQSLSERGVRFLKIAGDVILARVPQTGAQVHPADLTDLLGRYGIDLIAERIESEEMVVDLLDFDLSFGQGHLFSPPRPVRADVLKGEIAEFPVAEAKPAEAPRRQNDLAKLAAKTVRRA
jgi:cyclic-di-GMP phosphodiesterase TipF (flagellum assembly factor)